MKKEKKMRVVHVGTHKKTVTVLWAILILSVCFGVYKNFTAIDKHTVHEKEVIKERLTDTNSIENFVTDFAKVYYQWENNKDSLDNRTTIMSWYLTEELQNLNVDTVRLDTPTCSYVKEVKIWDISSYIENEYVVTYSVLQDIKEGEVISSVMSYYAVTVYMDEYENLVIIRNPTLAEIPAKSDYVPKSVGNDGNVTADTMNEVTEFLKTFFGLYPALTKEELVYYVKDSVLSPVTGDYVFSELVNPVFVSDGDSVKCYVSVKYLDNRTKSTQISQYVLKLQKGDNWMIVGTE